MLIVTYIAIQKYDFCILILYPTTLLNSLIISSSLLWIQSDFLCWWSCSKWIKTVLLHRPPSLDAFYFFSCFITLTRTSRPMLNWRGESRHPCFVLDIRGRAFSFSPLISMMLIVGFLQMLLINLSSLLFLLCWEFLLLF